MANFNRIHGAALDAARGKIRLGQIWNVAIQEPIRFMPQAATTPAETMAKIVRYRADRDGTLRPASVEDEKLIADWKRRHHDTPDTAFLGPWEILHLQTEIETMDAKGLADKYISADGGPPKKEQKPTGMRLGKVLEKAARLKLKEMGFEPTLPENPTLDDIKAEAFRIAQAAKEIQNSDEKWADEDWRKISQSIEKIEAMIRPKR